MPRLFEQYLGKEQQLLDVLYRDWPVGEEVRNINQAAIDPTLTHSAVGKALRHFESLGIVTKRLEYGQHGTPAFGRHYHYTLLVTKDVAQKLLSDSVDKRRIEGAERLAEGNRRSADARRGKPGKPRKVEPGQTLLDLDKVALATSDKEEVRAIAGDEPDTTLRPVFQAARKGGAPDESAALVEAARQYQGRSGALRSKVTELEAIAKDLGMTIDTAALMATVSFEPDPVLEIVGQVLPYVTSLEQRIARQAEHIAEQRAKLNGVAEIEREVRALREQNRRLLARSTPSPQPVAHA